MLPVQGPPGSGKTYIGAEMILSLVAAGKKVGIVAFTHRALTNLLNEVLEHAARQRLHAAIRKLESNEKPDGPALPVGHEQRGGGRFDPRARRARRGRHR